MMNDDEEINEDNEEVEQKEDEKDVTSEKKVAIAELIKKLQTTEVNNNNRQQLKNDVIIAKNIIDSSLGDSYDRIKMMTSEYKKILEKKAVVQDLKEGSPPPRRLFDLLVDINNARKHIDSWRIIKDELSFIYEEKLDESLGSYQGLDIQKEVLTQFNRLNNDTYKHANDLMKQSMEFNSQYIKQTIDMALQQFKQLISVFDERLMLEIDNIKTQMNEERKDNSKREREEREISRNRRIVDEPRHLPVKEMIPELEIEDIDEEEPVIKPTPMPKPVMVEKTDEKVNKLQKKYVCNKCKRDNFGSENLYKLHISTCKVNEE